MKTPIFSALKAALIWLLVLVPLGWGVWKSVEKSMPLFRDARPAKCQPITR
jgi:hypothetical protein